MGKFGNAVRTVLVVCLAGFGLTTCGGDGSEETETETDDVTVVSSELTAKQCSHFANNGKTVICHKTGSKKNPYVVLKVSEKGCAKGHAGHRGDYVAVGDPTCKGGGCLPASAPCDRTVPCCTGRCKKGVCEGPVCLADGAQCDPLDQQRLCCSNACTCTPLPDRVCTCAES